MDKKGQSLTVLVLLLPFIFLLILVVGEIGNLMIVQNRYEREVKKTIKYGIKNIEKEDIQNKLNELLNSNIEGEKTIKIENNIIEIKVHKPYKIFKINYDIDIDMIGYKENEKIKIESKW